MIPNHLKPGDRIGIVAPSAPVTAEVEEKFNSGIAYLHGLGFEVSLGRYVYSTSWGQGASPQEKAADINEMFADSSIQAILCAQGGENANACLPYLDYSLIQKTPKIFVGISDITVLLNALHQKTGLITFHGNDVIWGFGRKPKSYDREEWISRLSEGKIGLVRAFGERVTIRRGSATGKLMGGNLHCLLKLAGTPYFPRLEGTILFLEALSISLESCEAYFQQLDQMGVLKSLQGVVIGYIHGLQKDGGARSGMEDVLARVSETYAFPILKVNDFGHNCANTVIPVGGRVHLDADAQTIEILSACVQ